MKEILFKQLDQYSLGIIAFIVIQGLTFSYYFGSNDVFNCRIHKSKFLSEILTFMFIFISILSMFGIKYIENKKMYLFPEYKIVGKNIIIGKSIIILIFGFFPPFLTFYYGYLGKTPDRCDLIFVY
tara:strand:- start:181 stop:558 length:378 start_codon:yes stop_codon:yes gene_type:complete